MNNILKSLQLCSLLLVLFTTIGTSSVFAQTSSTSASTTEETGPSPTPSLTETTQRLKERIGKIVEEKRDQIEGALDDLASQRRGFIGEVQRVTSETLTLKTNKGTQILPLSPEIKITKANKPISVDGIAVGDWAVVIGTLEDDSLRPNQLVISSTTLRPKPQTVVLGTVTEITRTTATIQPRSGQSAVEFNLVRTTTYEDSEGNPLRVADIKANTQVLAVGSSGTDGIDALVIRSLAAPTESDDQ